MTFSSVWLSDALEAAGLFDDDVDAPLLHYLTHILEHSWAVDAWRLTLMFMLKDEQIDRLCLGWTTYPLLKRTGPMLITILPREMTL